MSATRRSADRLAYRLANRVLALTAGRRLMPAIAALLALLVVAILIAFNAVSAEETPTHQAAINDDPNLNRPLPTTTCNHSINSDATCDLSMRLWNRHTTTEATFTLLEVGVNGAFDSSTITPDNTERYSTQTLGDCPCEYTVPPRGYETFRMTIRVGTMTDGYRTSNIRIFRGTDMTRSQTPLNEYRLRLVDVTTPPDPTVITVGEITDHTVALTWTADSHASSYIVFWWPKGAMDDSSMGATNDKAYTITALDADTLYVIKVQALVRGKNLASDQVDVRTTGAPEPSVITVGTVTDTTIALTWTADSDATSFAVSWWPKADVTSLSTATTTNQARTIRSLTPSTLYVLKVQATVGSATVDSAEVEVTTKSVLGSPVITVGEVTDTTIALSWTADSSATSFTVSWWPKADPTQSSTATTTSLTHTITALSQSTLYVLQVDATVGSTTLESAEVEVTTKAKPLRCPHPGHWGRHFDYDQDDDGLIEICTLAQLDAIRYDLNGNGKPDVYLDPTRARPSTFGHTGSASWAHGDFTDAERVALYRAAFPSPAAGMGCSQSAKVEAGPLCRGYELIRDLDFDENGNGLRDDTYNTGAGWRPIMGKMITDWNIGRMFASITKDQAYDREKMFSSTFEGNGHTISNLYINNKQWYVGLFGYIGNGQIRNLGLIAPKVHGRENVGAFAGTMDGSLLFSSYARDIDVRAEWFYSGGLVGHTTGTQVIESYVTGQVYAESHTGGLTGILGDWVSDKRNPRNETPGIMLSFASVDVSGYMHSLGGLVGARYGGYIHGAYATGTVHSYSMVGQGYGENAVTRTGSVIGFFYPGGPFIYPPYTPFMVQAVYGRGEVKPGATDVIGGFAGQCYNWPRGEVRKFAYSYWDTQTTGQTSSACPRAQENAIKGLTSAQLKAPTNDNAYDAGSIYEHWKVKAAGSWVDPWDFGTSEDYPVLDYCSDPTERYCPLREYHALPRASIAGGDAITEGVAAVFTVSLEETHAWDVDVQVFVSEVGLFASSEDQLGRRVVTIPAGSTSATISVATEDDAAYDEDGKVDMRLTPTASYTIAEPQNVVNAHASIAVADNDTYADISVKLSVDSAEISSKLGSTLVRITLSRTLEAGERVRVPITVVGGEPYYYWVFREDQLGTAVELSGAQEQSVVEIGPGGRVAGLDLLALPSDGTKLTFKFGTGERAPSSLGATAVNVSASGSPPTVTIK